MNREILFRGKRVDNGEWVEGTYFQGNEWNLIITAMRSTDFMHEYTTMEAYEVIPESVGQFTGLLDKNGKKIFEGDTLRLWEGQGNNGRLRRPHVLPVEYSDLWCQFVVADNPNKMQYGIWQGFTVYEVIGNIHDSPELLEVEK